MDIAQCCLYCDAVQDCSFLRDSSKQFSPFRVIHPGSDENCNGWTPLSGPRQKDVRDRLFATMGPGSIRILFSLQEMATKELKQMEEEEYEMMQTPDLASIIHEGMTVSEREYQLRHLTDEQGNVELDEDGEPVVRPSYELRNFAISPDYHIKLDRDVGLFWSTKQVVDHIIKSELEEGLITKDSKKTKGSASDTGAPKKAAAPKETKKMAAGKRVILRRGGKGASKSDDAPAKAKTTTKKTVTKGKAVTRGKSAAPSKAAAPEEAPVAAPEGFDMELLIDAIVPRVSEVVEARLGSVEEKLNEVIGYIEDAKGTSLDATTLLHDVAAQAIMAMNGNINSLASNLIRALTEEGAEIDYEPVDIELNGDLFEESNKILAYIPESQEGNE